MEPTLDDLRRSAELAGKVNVKPDCGDIVFWERGMRLIWHPPSKPYQDRELLHAIRAAGWQVHYNDIKWMHWITHPSKGLDILIEGDTNDFLTLAASRLQGMKG